MIMLLAAAAASSPTVLRPSGPWAVEYAQNMCVLSRPFGTGADRLIFAFKPAPNSDSGRLMLIRAAGREMAAQGKAHILLSDGSRPDWATFWSSAAKGNSLTAIDLRRSSLEPLFKGGSITIQAGKQINVAIHPSGMPNAMKALAKCESDLLTQWGMDEAAQAAMAKLPEREGKPFFRPDDYPDDLLDKGIQGSVGVLMNVDERGQLINCRAVETSGTPVLDEATCNVLRKRARFRPAISRDGEPMAALTYWRVTWQIADGYTYEMNPANTANSPPAGMPPVN
jgi:TonB family protein